jgi:hypothetical protein
MRVAADHRSDTAVYEPAIYDVLAAAAVEQLASTGLVESLVVCGSVVKHDIIPGWSDLDLVVILRDPLSAPDEVLSSIAEALHRAQGDIKIGIGADIVLARELKPEGRLGGRPLAMSYEVASYGRVAYGPSPFTSLPPLAIARGAIIAERTLLMRAEIHNWRRLFLMTEPENRRTAGWAASSIKTTLKLLKHAVEPDTASPFTHASYLEVLRQHTNDAALLSAATAAVDARSRWPEISTDAEALRTTVAILDAYLAAGAPSLESL